MSTSARGTVRQNVSTSIRSQALCALLFLYRIVLEREVGEFEGLVRARRRRKLPVVLSREEVRSILGHLAGADRLFFQLLYGTGMRLMEALRLRVKDVDLSFDQITVRDGKGAKDRVTMLPAADLSTDPRSGERRRHHLYDRTVQKVFREGGAQDRDRQACDVPYAETLLSRPTCSRADTTSGRCRSFWATRA